ncbi:MAG TPA: response regulator transcription factor [Burkholderiaceae bacterium]|nr:response regulator transcription factor [Burkholderiaceae bacterium]
MRLLLIDDHALFRHGLKFLLTDLDAAIEFVEAEGTDELPPCSDDAPAIDLALLDLHLQGTSGTAALAELRRRLPDTTVVVMTGDDDPALVRDCIDAGAAGFIPKSSTPPVMISALRLVLAGGTYLPPHTLEAGVRPAQTTDRSASWAGDSATAASSSAGRIEREAKDFATGAASRLSARQLEVLLLAIRGRSNKMIARELDLSEGTIKQHLSAAFRTLGVANRTEAVFAAAELGLRITR